MKNKDVERLFSNSNELAPNPSLKERVISTALPIKTGQAQGEVVAKKGFFTSKKIIALVMALIMLVTGIMLSLNFTGYSSVFIDVNPSIELTVNRWSKIVEVQCLNQDALEVFDEMEVSGENIEDGMEKVLDLLNDKGYLQDGELSIGVYCKNQNRAEKVLNKFSNSANKYKKEKGCNVNITGKKLKEKKNKRCEELGISPVKYELILQIIEKDYTYTAEMLKDKTVKELKEILGSKNNKK